MIEFLLLVLIVAALVEQDKLSKQINLYNQNNEKILKALGGPPKFSDAIDADVVEH